MRDGPLLLGQGVQICCTAFGISYRINIFFRRRTEAGSRITHSIQLIVVLVSFAAPKIRPIFHLPAGIYFPFYSNVTRLTIMRRGIFSELTPHDIVEEVPP